MQNTCKLFTVHEVTIPVRSMLDTIHIVPVGDIHWGSPLHATDEFDEFCEWGRRQRNTYYLGMGDPYEFLSASERVHLIASGNLHESTEALLEEVWLQDCKALVKKTSFMAGHLIGMIEGGHYAVLTGGITTTQKMIEMYARISSSPVRAEYLGICGFIRVNLELRTPRGGPRRTCLDIFAHHGRTGGRTTGGQVNAAEGLVKIADANLYIMAHAHKKFSIPEARLKLEKHKGKLFVKDRLFSVVRSGGFHRGYVAGYQSYVADAAYEPVVLGAPIISIHLKETKEKGFHYEIKGTA